MSEAVDRNVETMRRGLEAFSRADWDEALALTHPEVEWHLTFRLPDLPPDKLVYRGHEEVREVWQAFASVWESLTIEIEEIVSADIGRVVARARFHGRGAGSGADADRTVFYLFELEDDLLRSIRPFETEAEAMDAAGLDPDD